MTGLTVGLPVYNGAATIEATIEALLAQTYRDFTLLISDNASTDETPAIIERFARRDGRIQVVRQATNINASGNFWYLIENAVTPMFGWCAADDVPQPTYLERCVAGLQANPNAMLCCTDVIFVLKSGERWKYIENLDTVGCAVDARLHRLMNRHGWYASYGIGWRDRMLAFGPPGVRYGADVAYTAAWLCSWDIACVREPLLHFLFVPKDAAAYAKSTGSTDPVATRPFTQMLGDIGATVRKETDDAGVSRRLMRVLARTLAFENPSLCGVVLDENAIHPATIDDAARFAFFLRIFSGNGSDAESHPARA